MLTHPKVALEVRLTDRILSWGSGQYYEVVNIIQTRLVNGPRLKHDRDAIVRRPSRTCTFPRRRRVFQSERIQRACPPIGPNGRTGTMPRMRRGDFDQTDRTYGRTRPRTPHVRMQAMPRATSIHRRSRERSYLYDTTLAGQSPAPPSLNRTAWRRPPALHWSGFRCEPPVCGV
jgi:hypothetical protein